MSVLLAVFACLLLILMFLYKFSLKNHNYWKKRNVPFVKPFAFFGNFKDYILMKEYSPKITRSICEQFPDAPYVGVFYGTDPALVIKDPELIKLILTRDFYYFNGREVSDYTHREVITQNIFFTQGDRWKILRQNLTLLFSSSKVKNMFYLIKKCAEELEVLLEREYKNSTVKITDLMSRYTIDGVSLCGFGINANTMGKDTIVNPFRIISKKILEISPYNGIKNIGRTLWPNIFYGLGFRMFSPQVNDFFNKLLTEVFKGREYQPTARNDFVDLILSLYNKSVISGDSLTNLKTGDNQKIEMKVDSDLLVSQCVAFFAGGFETSSNALAFTLFELAKYDEIQKRAIADVDSYFLRHKDGVEFNITNEVPYLEACIDETLRVYPLLGVITREVMENYTLPSGLKLEKGLRIHIPVYYLHYNPDYFPNPEEYNPERFLGAGSKNIKSYTYLPFGEGPRICIGLKFAKMMMLTGLATILRKYEVRLAEGMPRKVRLEPKAIVTQPGEDIILKFIPRHS